jgi:hypothetical protein
MQSRAVPAAFLVLLAAVLLAAPAFAQNGSGSSPAPKGGMQQPFGQSTSAADNIDPNDSLWQEKQLRLLNVDRQKQLVADTNKLLKLAQELDAEIAGANPGSLTPDQLRRIAEIEKLAHSVKEKMSTSVRGVPAFRPEPPTHMR